MPAAAWPRPTVFPAWARASAHDVVPASDELADVGLAGCGRSRIAGLGWGHPRLSLCPPRTAALFRSAVANKDWHAKVDGGGVAGAAVELDQLVVGGGEADLQED
jgi:hypothetical protein